jgi:hypothetical protein
LPFPVRTSAQEQSDEGKTAMRVQSGLKAGQSSAAILD